MDPNFIAILERQQQQNQENVAQMQALYQQMLQVTQQAQQAQQAATAAATAAGMSARQQSAERRQISSVLDPKCLESIKTFSGKDEDYPEWEVKLKSTTTLLGLDGEMAVAIAEPTKDSVMLEALPADEVRNKAKALYHILIQSCQGKALTIVLTCEENNGLQAWRRVKREYKPEVAPRHNAMPISLLTPKFSSDRPFTEQITEWGRNIDEYRKANGRVFGDPKRSQSWCSMRQRSRSPPSSPQLREPGTTTSPSRRRSSTTRLAPGATAGWAS